MQDMVISLNHFVLFKFCFPFFLSFGCARGLSFYFAQLVTPLLGLVLVFIHAYLGLCI